SYTMFPVEKKQPVASSAPAAGSSNKIPDSEASLGG
ncbi:cytochrome c oxidase assembly protein, partial [Mesorhizobium sp. M00.F.Ca.ET.038.03.1.1]